MGPTQEGHKTSPGGPLRSSRWSLPGDRGWSEQAGLACLPAGSLVVSWAQRSGAMPAILGVSALGPAEGPEGTALPLPGPSQHWPQA